MSGDWAVRYVDKQVDQAWLALRLDLAERFAAGLEAGEMEPLDFTAPSGETLTAVVEDGHVVVYAGDEARASANVDAAAYTVFQVLHVDWQVVHPVFLDAEVVEVPQVSEVPQAPLVPELAQASSQEQLHAWVLATFQAMLDRPYQAASDGRMHWKSPKGRLIAVQVHNAARVEFTSVVARNVGLKKARAVIDDLALRLFGIKMYLVQDTLMMAQIVLANPFSPEQLRNALATFAANVDQVGGWVPDRVMRKRVRREKADLEAAEQAKAAAERSAARARAALSAARAERDAARRELTTLKRRLSHALHPITEETASTEEGRE